ncbi:MAG: class F sortase [Candidatus Kerfeldbacteria bacterium]|nr:class F sortase [Candidatus Kerfeldbacteria bacterium]
MKLSKRFSRGLMVVSLLAWLVSPVTAAAATRSSKPVPFGAPVELRIKKIGVKAKIEKTSVDRKGQLEAPKKPSRVGWYRNGTVPGKRGNAVIGGHVNWYTGPAVFQGLGRLRRGDIVEVKNDHGRVLKFRVTKVGTYYNGSVPVAQITGPTAKFALNLYTCTGRYSRSAKNYSHRVVVFTELVR